MGLFTAGVAGAGQLLPGRLRRVELVVVGPSADGRCARGPTDLSGVLGEDTADEVAEWVRGRARRHRPAGVLDLAVFSSSRRSRAEAGEI